jgi:tripartite-type tricarboxylate transporter receptor subunit TctC
MSVSGRISADSASRRLATLALLLFASIGEVTAQTYPSHPISVVVPLAAGGTTDTVARILAEGMRASLGQPLIIENVTGAGGSLGVARAARSTPDGYSLIVGNWASHVGSGAIYPVKYDLLKDFEPIVLVATTPLWIVARKTFPADDLRGLIAWLKANPDKASAATVGAGSPSHLCALYFQQSVGANLQVVPYRGGGPAIQDLLAGQIDLMCDTVANSLPLVRSGQIKAYAVMAPDRWSTGRVEDGRGSLCHSATPRFPSPLIRSPTIPHRARLGGLMSVAA